MGMLDQVALGPAGECMSYNKAGREAGPLGARTDIIQSTPSLT